MLPALLGLLMAGPAAADSSRASYVLTLGGTIIANADFTLVEDGKSYELKLDANVAGLASLIGSGIARATSKGSVTADGLRATSFDLLTRSGGEDFTVSVGYERSNATTFKVTPPIIDTIDRIPLERKHLGNVNDMLAPFILRGSKLDRSLCNYRQQVFTGVERFDLDFRFAKDDVATSQRTGYQGPVVLCNVRYKPISGHYTSSEITNSLAQDERILVWYAPLRDTGFFVPYRVLLNTSIGDLSMVLTRMN